MRTIITALALSAMLTVGRDERDADPSVRADGRYIAFTTFSKLAAADRDEARDVYVLDRRDHRVTFESAALEAEGSHPAISGDGRFLVYEAAGRIIFRDRNQDAIRFLGNGRQPSISADGGTVVFTAANFGGISVWNMQSARVASIGSRVSVSPSVSADGRCIAFSTDKVVFVHDRQTAITEHIGAGWDPAISATAATSPTSLRSANVLTSS